MRLRVESQTPAIIQHGVNLWCGTGADPQSVCVCVYVYVYVCVCVCVCVCVGVCGGHDLGTDTALIVQHREGHWVCVELLKESGPGDGNRI